MEEGRGKKGGGGGGGWGGETETTIACECSSFRAHAFEYSSARAREIVFVSCVILKVASKELETGVGGVGVSLYLQLFISAPKMGAE